MKKAIIGFVVAVFLVSVSYAGVIYDGRIVASSTAQKLASVPDDAVSCLLTVEGGYVRVTFSTAPAQQEGHRLAAGDSMVIDSLRDMKALKIVLDLASAGATVYYSISGK